MSDRPHQGHSCYPARLPLHPGTWVRGVNLGQLLGRSVQAAPATASATLAVLQKKKLMAMILSSPLFLHIKCTTIYSVRKHQHEIEKTMWTSLHIIPFCIHRNLPFGRFFEENNPNTDPVWGFFMFICIAKMPAGTPKPLLLLFTTTYTHIHKNKTKR